MFIDAKASSMVKYKILQKSFIRERSENDMFPFGDDGNSKDKRTIILMIGFTALIVLQICAIAIRGGFSKNAASPASDKISSASDTDSGTSAAAQPSAEDIEKQRKIVVPMLVNTDHVMSASFKPNNLVKIGKEIKGTSSLQINATVRSAYLVMQADMEKADIKMPMIISAYRSYSRQKELYDAKVKQYGAGQKVTAVPGTSEHQYSACIDISTDGTCQNNFGELPTGIWIADNSYKYGFVVRYPEKKKEFTKINFEPWHLRYVGVEHATKMHELDMCLEEYVEYLWANYPNAYEETSPDQFPAPRFAGDAETSSADAASTISQSDTEASSEE